MLESMEQISKAHREIKKYYKHLKLMKKLVQQGKKTQAEYDAIAKSFHKVFTYNFALACEWGMGMGQTDELGWDERSELHATDVLENLN